MEFLTKSSKRDARAKLARQLQGWPTRETRLAFMRGAMDEAGVAVREGHNPDFRLNFLGRSASCTYAAEGAIWNWITATLKEFPA